MKKLPILLIGFRFCLAPFILFLAWKYGQGAALSIIVLMYLGLGSDILDGIVARYAGNASARLRRLDSQTDLMFWLSIGFASWILYPDIIRQHRGAILVIFVMEALCYVISILRFGKETCTHAFLAKMWGLSMLAAFTALIGFGHAGVPFWTAIILGFVSHLDRILITLILPHWTHDIPSAYHAWLIRKGRPFRRFKLFN